MHEKKKKLYLIKADGYIKIGISENPERRLNQLRTGCPLFPHIWFMSDFLSDAIFCESFFHSFFKKYNSYGEWFKLSYRQVRMISSTVYFIDKKPSYIRKYGF